MSYVKSILVYGSDARTQSPMQQSKHKCESSRAMPRRAGRVTPFTVHMQYFKLSSSSSFFKFSSRFLRRNQLASAPQNKKLRLL